MNAKQKIRKANLSKWADLVHDQQASGLTIKAWCDQNNVSFHAYNYWKHILKEEYVNSILPEIVPLSKPEVIPAQETDSQLKLRELRDSCDSYNPSQTITVSIGDVRIEIGSAASDKMITNIIKAVRYA
jgi:hypothetical protein